VKGHATEVIRTRGGLEDDSGRVTVTTPDGASIALEHGRIVIQAPASVEIEASQIKASAAQVSVSAGMARFDGVVQCDTLIANSVVASSYTPGVGNQA
jgi:hypothetical protein